ncbi:MAG TPA: GWxTD domain-containing protein [Thermoanaerobaculia bacterium]|jgi:GWxTD domain-containing protein
MSQSRFRNAAFAFALSMVVASTASAALSEKYKEWREGPVQWIMTSDEMRAWRNVKTDEEAIDFIDLFWARRDPTPGTAVNEYHIDFDVYVNSADQQFAEKGRRGAMTDRGRVAIVLGRPTTGFGAQAYTSAAGAGVTGMSGSGRQQAALIEWTYDYAAAQKFGMPKASVVFLQDPVSGRIKRDVQRTDFIPASANAIRASIKSPELKSVPEWAMRGGLEQRTPEQIAAANAPPPPPAPVQTEEPSRTIAPAPVPVPEPAVTYEPKGASRLTLAHNVFDVDTEIPTDPFAKLTPVTSFKASDELGWASQYCTGSSAEPTVKFTLRLTGTAAGEVIDRSAEPEELVPDRIRALNGCYMLRGAVPLEGMNPGNYELEVAIYDPETRRDVVLKKPFRIQ